MEGQRSLDSEALRAFGNAIKSSSRNLMDAVSPHVAAAPISSFAATLDQERFNYKDRYYRMMDDRMQGALSLLETSSLTLDERASMLDGALTVAGEAAGNTLPYMVGGYAGGALVVADLIAAQNKAANERKFGTFDADSFTFVPDKEAEAEGFIDALSQSAQEVATNWAARRMTVMGAVANKALTKMGFNAASTPLTKRAVNTAAEAMAQYESRALLSFVGGTVAGGIEELVREPLVGATVETVAASLFRSAGVEVQARDWDGFSRIAQNFDLSTKVGQQQFYGTIFFIGALRGVHGVASKKAVDAYSQDYSTLRSVGLSAKTARAIANIPNPQQRRERLGLAIEQEIYADPEAHLANLQSAKKEYIAEAEAALYREGNIMKEAMKQAGVLRIEPSADGEKNLVTVQDAQRHMKDMESWEEVEGQRVSPEGYQVPTKEIEMTDAQVEAVFRQGKNGMAHRYAQAYRSSAQGLAMARSADAKLDYLSVLDINDIRTQKPIAELAKRDGLITIPALKALSEAALEYESAGAQLIDGVQNSTLAGTPDAFEQRVGMAVRTGELSEREGLQAGTNAFLVPKDSLGDALVLHNAGHSTSPEFTEEILEAHLNKAIARGADPQKLWDEALSLRKEIKEATGKDVWRGMSDVSPSEQLMELKEFFSHLAQSDFYKNYEDYNLSEESMQQLRWLDAPMKQNHMYKVLGEAFNEFKSTEKGKAWLAQGNGLADLLKSAGHDIVSVYDGARVSADDVRAVMDAVHLAERMTGTRSMESVAQDLEAAQAEESLRDEYYRELESPVTEIPAEENVTGEVLTLDLAADAPLDVVSGELVVPQGAELLTDQAGLGAGLTNGHYILSPDGVSVYGTANPHDIGLSDDVPQFKSTSSLLGRMDAKADGTTYELSGAWNPSSPPIDVWRRADGRLEVISGRHRLAHAKRHKAQHIMVRVYDESATHDAQWARMHDVEQNILDNRGSAVDIAYFYRHNPISRAEAERRGLMPKTAAGEIAASARVGLTIAQEASPNTYDAVMNGAASAGDAYHAITIASTPEGQALALQERNKGGRKQSWEYVTAFVRGVEQQGSSGAQLDLFGHDTSWQERAEKTAKYVSRARATLKEQMAVIRNGRKLEQKGKVAKRLGVEVKNPEDAAQLLMRLKLLDEAYERMDGELGIPSKVEAWDGKSSPEVSLDELPFAYQRMAISYSLTPREQMIVSAFDRVDARPVAEVDIPEIYTVTPQQVRQLMKASLDKLKTPYERENRKPASISMGGRTVFIGGSSRQKISSHSADRRVAAAFCALDDIALDSVLIDIQENSQSNLSKKADIQRYYYFLNKVHFSGASKHNVNNQDEAYVLMVVEERANGDLFHDINVRNVQVLDTIEATLDALPEGRVTKAGQEEQGGSGNRIDEYLRVVKRNRGGFDGRNPDITFSIAGSRAQGFDKAKAEGRTYIDQKDGKEKFFLDVSSAKIRDDLDLHTIQKKGQTDKYTELADVLDFPDLYEAYPHFKNFKVSIYGFRDSIGGEFVENTKVFGRFSSNRWGYHSIDINTNVESFRNREALLSIVIHEVQHAIQAYEGFSSGFSSSPSHSEALAYLREAIRQRRHLSRLNEKNKANYEALVELEKELRENPNSLHQRSSHRGGIADLLYSMSAGEMEAKFAEERLPHNGYLWSTLDSYALFPNSVSVKRPSLEGRKPDISFSVRNLVSAHTLDVSRLKESAKLGGMPLPSIAVTRIDKPYAWGSPSSSLTLIAGSELADPEQGNDVYTADAYTGVFPSTVNKKSDKAQDVLDKIQKLAKQAEKYNLESASSIYDSIVRRIESSQSKSEQINNLLHHSNDMYLLFAAKSKYRPKMEQEETSIFNWEDSELRRDSEIFAEVLLSKDSNDKEKQEAIDKYALQLEAASERIPSDMPFRKMRVSSLKLPAERIRNTAFDFESAINQAKDIWSVIKADRKKELKASWSDLKNYADANSKKFDKFKQEIADYYSDELILEESGEAVTLDTVTRHMKYNKSRGNEQGALGMNNGQVFAARAQKIHTLTELKSQRDTLVSTVEHSELKSSAVSKMEAFGEALAASIHEDYFTARDTANKILADAPRASRASIANAMKDARLSWKKGAKKAQLEILGTEAVDAIDALPMDYFESVPQRAVALNEWKFALASSELKTDRELTKILRENKIKPIWHDGTQEGRAEAMASLQKARVTFSISTLDSLTRVSQLSMLKEEQTARLLREAQQGINRLRRVFSSDDNNTQEAARELGVAYSLMSAINKVIERKHRPKISGYMNVIEAYAKAIEKGKLTKAKTFDAEERAIFERELERELEARSLDEIEELLEGVNVEVAHTFDEYDASSDKERMKAAVRAIAGQRVSVAVERMLADAVEGLEAQLISKERERTTTLLDRLAPKKGKNGKLVKGKMNADSYRKIASWVDMMNATAERRTERMGELELALAAGRDVESDGTERFTAQEQREIELKDWATFGHVEGMSLEEIRRMNEALKIYALTSKSTWEAKLEHEKRLMEGIAERAVKGMGRADDFVRGTKKDLASYSPWQNIKDAPAMLQSLAQHFYALSEVEGLGGLAQESLKMLSSGHLELNERERRANDQLQQFMIEALDLKKEKERDDFMVHLNKEIDTGIDLGGELVTHTLVLTQQEARRWISMTKEQRALARKKEEEAQRAKGYAPKDIVQEKDIPLIREELAKKDANLAKRQKKNKDAQPYGNVHISRKVRAGNGSRVKASRNRILNILLTYDQPDYTRNADKHGYTPEVLDKLREAVGADVWAFGVAMRDIMNNNGLAVVYEDREGNPFPAVVNHWAARFDQSANSKDISALDATLTSGAKHSFLMIRQKHDLNVDTSLGATNVFFSAMAQQNNYIVMGEITAKWRKLLANKQFAHSFEAYMGHTEFLTFKELLNALDGSGVMESVTQRGLSRLIKQTQSAHAPTVLAGSLMTLARQVPALMNASAFGGFSSRQFITQMLLDRMGKGRIGYGEMSKLRAITARYGEDRRFVEMMRHGQNVTYSRLNAWSRAGMNAIQKMDIVTNTFGSVALYNLRWKQLEERNKDALDPLSEEEMDADCQSYVEQALEIGAQPLRQTQKSAMAALNAGNALVRTLFYMGSEPIGKIGLAQAEGKRAGGGWKKSWALYKTLVKYSVPTQIIAMGIESFLGYGADEDESIWAYLGYNAATAFTGLGILNSAPILGAMLAAIPGGYVKTKGFADAIFDVRGLMRSIEKLFKASTDDKEYTEAEWVMMISDGLRAGSAITPWNGGINSTSKAWSFGSSLLQSVNAGVNAIRPFAQRERNEERR